MGAKLLQLPQPQAGKAENGKSRLCPNIVRNISETGVTKVRLAQKTNALILDSNAAYIRICSTSEAGLTPNSHYFFLQTHISNISYADFFSKRKLALALVDHHKHSS